MALYILGVCWHESAFIFSSLQKEGNKLQYDEDSFFLPLSLFLFIQKTDSSALHAVYVLLLFSSAWCTSHFITESESFFFKTSIVILLVSYTTFMSYHFQVLLAALSQQVQGTL